MQAFLIVGGSVLLLVALSVWYIRKSWKKTGCNCGYSCDRSNRNSGSSCGGK